MFDMTLPALQHCIPAARLSGRFRYNWVSDFEGKETPSWVTRISSKSSIFYEYTVYIDFIIKLGAFGDQFPHFIDNETGDITPAHMLKQWLEDKKVANLAYGKLTAFLPHQLYPTINLTSSPLHIANPKPQTPSPKYVRRITNSAPSSSPRAPSLRRLVREEQNS